MANSNGSATGPVDLLTKLVAFLVANGWTSDHSAALGTGWWATLHKSGLYVHLRAAVNEQPWQHGSAAGYHISLYLGTAYNSGADWNAQTAGAPIESGGTNPIGAGLPLLNASIPNYWFFANGDDIVAVVQKSGNVFAHLGFGPSLTKFGTWTGGAYFFASEAGYYADDNANPPQNGHDTTSDCPGVGDGSHAQPNTFVRADVDSFTSKWISIGDNTSFAPAYTGKRGSSCVIGSGGGSSHNEFPRYGDPNAAASFQNLQTSSQDSRANLLPVTLWALRDGAGTGFSPLGNIPNVFFANAVGRGFAQTSDYVIGSDTYKLFPNFAVLKT